MLVYIKIQNWLEFTDNTKNSNTCCTVGVDISIVISDCCYACEQYNCILFDWTMGFYWSYMLLLKPPMLDIIVYHCKKYQDKMQITAVSEFIEQVSL